MAKLAIFLCFVLFASATNAMGDSIGDNIKHSVGQTIKTAANIKRGAADIMFAIPNAVTDFSKKITYGVIDMKDDFANYLMKKKPEEHPVIPYTITEADLIIPSENIIIPPAYNTKPIAEFENKIEETVKKMVKDLTDLKTVNNNNDKLPSEKPKVTTKKPKLTVDDIDVSYEETENYSEELDAATEEPKFPSILPAKNTRTNNLFPNALL